MGFSERVKDINAPDALAAEHTVVVYDRREAGRSGGRVERLGGKLHEAGKAPWIICESIPPMSWAAAWGVR